MSIKIPAIQLAVLDKLAMTLAGRFYLVGGVAVAAHLGHRISHDLDFFTSDDPTQLQGDLEELPGVTVLSRSGKTLHLRVDGVPVSLINYRYRLLEPASPIADLPVPVAAISDLACMKLSAIANRGAARDFWDLHSLIVATNQPLEHYLEEFRRKYPVEDIGHVIRSLVYFGDAATEPLPIGLGIEHWSRICRDFELWARAIATRD